MDAIKESNIASFEDNMALNKTQKFKQKQTIQNNILQNKFIIDGNKYKYVMILENKLKYRNQLIF